MREYDQIAEWYTSTRSPTVGVPEVTAFVQALPSRARVLDLGCGDGVPITRLLVRGGFDVVGLDSSAEMVQRFRANLPGVPVQCGRAEEANFADESFEAVVAWGVLFHLSEADQRSLISKVSDWLTPGGTFLFTSGDAEGVREGTMNGVVFRYVSFGPSGYRHLLDQVGMRLERHGSDACDNHVYVAEKTR